MIIDARDDVVTLSGRLETNHWLSIQAAAQLLLRQHPNGILIDAAEITECSPDGARTFLDGLEYIERHRARIVLCQVPESVMAVLRAVPEVRSQVPIAPTCEAARTSLELAVQARVEKRSRRRSDGDSERPTVFVPVLEGTPSVVEALGIAHVLGTEHDDDKGREGLAPHIKMSYVIVVPRSIPLTSPLEEEEIDVRRLLDGANEFAQAKGLTLEADVARTRDAAEEIIEIASLHKASKIIMMVPPRSVDSDMDVRGIIGNVLLKSPCEVLIGKRER